MKWFARFFKFGRDNRSDKDEALAARKMAEIELLAAEAHSRTVANQKKELNELIIANHFGQNLTRAFGGNK